MRGEYFAIEFVVFVVAYLIDRLFKLHVLSSRRLLRVALASTVIFGAWDVHALANAHWGFGSAYMLGYVWLFPIEELLLIVILIPYIPIITWEASKRVFHDV